MQTAILPMVTPSSASVSPHTGHGESVSQLLARGYNLPCSAAAQAFTQIVAPSNRFQIALSALLPILETSTSEFSHRILVAFILYFMYAPHPIRLNPFRSALYETFTKERELAVTNPNHDDHSEREQLIWILYKILRGDGQDLGPFSPSQLVQSALPAKLRASSLIISDDPEDDPIPASAIEQPVELQIPVSAETNKKTYAFSQGMTLLLAARDRVLTLSELRLLNPLILDLISPPIITSFDLPRIITHNPTLAHPLLVAMLTRLPESVVVGQDTYLDVLAQLPPQMQTFDVLGHLLRDGTPAKDPEGGNTTVADLVRLEVLGRFIEHSIRWLDDAEAQEREGLTSDDRFGQGVKNLCRFYSSLIKLGIVDPGADTDSAEMITFTLRQARFEEANALYRTLAAGRF